MCLLERFLSIRKLLPRLHSQLCLEWSSLCLSFWLLPHHSWYLLSLPGQLCLEWYCLRLSFRIFPSERSLLGLCHWHFMERDSLCANLSSQVFLERLSLCLSGKLLLHSKLLPALRPQQCLRLPAPNLHMQCRFLRKFPTLHCLRHFLRDLFGSRSQPLSHLQVGNSLGQWAMPGVS